VALSSSRAVSSVLPAFLAAHAPSRSREIPEVREHALAP
jgi:hypothetical protein